MDQVAAAIAAAVEQQGAATREIAGHVQMVAQQNDAVCRSVQDVARIGEETGTASQSVQSSAQEVGEVSGLLRQEVDRFLASRRIAVWHGDNYACGLVDALGLRASGGLVRAGIVRYTTEDDVAALLSALVELGPA